MKVRMKDKSPPLSFSGWDILKFLKGRKKLLVTVIGVALGYIISDSATVATVSGCLIEMGFALGEFYVKER